jgi:type IV secretion system protein VirB10
MSATLAAQDDPLGVHTHPEEGTSPHRHKAGWPTLCPGPAGLKASAHAQVDFHTWQLIKGVALSTLLGVGAQLEFSGESDLVQALRESSQQNVSRAGDQLTSRNLQVQPTITVRPGAPVRLVIHKDIVLKPWLGD